MITSDNPLRFSRLKIISCPAKFKANPPYASTAMTEGTAVHAHILGGAPIISWEEGRPRKGKDFDAFKTDNDPRAIILTANSYRIARAMADSVLANKDAMRVLDGEREKTIYWDDCGIPCRGTPDAVSPGVRADLKTGETANPRDFIYKVLRFGYHAQLAWYERGEIIGTPGIAGYGQERDNYIVAVENKAPYVCTVFKLTSGDMDKGRRLVTMWMEQLRVCMASDHWPGYAQGIVDLGLPETEGGLIFDGGDE